MTSLLIQGLITYVLRYGVGGQPPDFEWSPAESRWEAIEIDGIRVSLAVQIRCGVISMLTKSSWAY